MDEDARRVTEPRMLRDARRVTQLEVLREAKGLSWTGLVVASELCHEDGSGFDVRTPKGWEERRHLPGSAAQKILCAFLKVGSITELGLGDGLEAARYRAWMTEDERKAEVKRRQFFIATGAVIGASVLPVSKLVAGAQLLDGAGHVSAAELTFATDVATHLASAYAATPNAEVITAAKAHAYTLLDRLENATMSPEVETRLRRIASDATALAGYGEMNAGRLDQAERWFADALTLARQAGDRQLEAYALASSAWIPLYAPKTDRKAVIAALESAAELQRFLRPSGRAYVFGFLSRERAALGDDLGSGRFLEHARAAAARVHYEEPGWGWWSAHGELGGWDGVRPEVFTGVRSLLLGRPAEALEIFDTALDGTTMPVRRAYLYEQVTNAYVALDDPDRACASAHAGLDEAATYGLGLDPKEMRKVRGTFPREWGALAPVVELDERLALAR